MVARVQRVREDKGKSIETVVPQPVMSKEEVSAFIPEARIKQIPSNFLPYPKDCSIFYRPYVFGELTEFNESKISEADEIRFILEGVRTSFPIMDLTYYDYIAITLLRRISSFGGSEFSFQYTCQKCQNKNRHTTTLDNLPFHAIDAPALPIGVKIGGVELKFMPLTVGIYIKLLESKVMENPKKRTVKMFAQEVVNMKPEEAEKIIHAAWNEESELLNHIDETLYHGVEPVKAVCKNVIKSPDTVLNGIIALCQERSKMEDSENKRKTWEDAALMLEEELIPPIEGEVCGHINMVTINRPEVLVRPFPLDRQSLRSKLQFG
jgi:hypothetical protein